MVRAGSPDPPVLCDRSSPSPRPSTRHLETYGRPIGVVWRPAPNKGLTCGIPRSRFGLVWLVPVDQVVISEESRNFGRKVPSTFPWEDERRHRRTKGAIHISLHFVGTGELVAPSNLGTKGAGTKGAIHISLVPESGWPHPIRSCQQTWTISYGRDRRAFERGDSAGNGRGVSFLRAYCCA